MKRSLLLMSCALALGAVACGGDDETAASSSASASASAPADGASASPADGDLRLLPGDPASLGAPAVPEAAPSSAPDATPIAAALEPYAAFGTDAEPGAFPRTVRHALGETTIEARPERVVVLDTGELDAMVELGITPVGAVDYGAAGLPAYLDGALDGVELVGSVTEPNLEAIAALRPDLILSSRLRHEELYGTLSGIAPTVFAERPGVSWRQNFALYAQAVGEEEAAADTVARYEERVRELNEALPEPRPAISVVRMLEDSVRYYQRANFLGTLFTDLGLPRPEAQNVDDFGVDLGQESIPEYADGDVVLLALYGGEANAFATSTIEGPLWQAVPAVRDGRVLEVDDQTWIGGIGYRAAFTVLDGLAEHLASSS